MKRIINYSKLASPGLYYWYSRNYEKPLYNFVPMSENEYEPGHSCSSEEYKKRYDDNFETLVKTYNQIGFISYLEHMAIDFSKKDLAKQQVLDIQKTKNFWSVFFEIDWDN